MIDDYDDFREKKLTIDEQVFYGSNSDEEEIFYYKPTFFHIASTLNRHDGTYKVTDIIKLYN